LSGQNPKRSGLPTSIGMRHDTHFVDWISKKTAAPMVRMIPLAKIAPNPHQARSSLGDIHEMMTSIKAKGVLEPIIVRPKGDSYEIIAGERRYIASKNVGLTEIPAIELIVNDSEAMEISLIENLQRKHLDLFEEADGLKALMEIYDYSHAQISEKIGKARSTITEIINISRVPHDVRTSCLESGLEKNRSLLIELSKLKTPEEMLALLKQIRERGLRREDTRDLTKEMKGKDGTAKIKHYVFNYRPKEDRSYQVRIEFKKEAVSRIEIIKVLEDLISKLKSSR